MRLAHLMTASANGRDGPKRYSSQQYSAVSFRVISETALAATSDVIEDIVTKTAAPCRKGVCLYCGLQSLETNHGSVGECVDALQREVARLRDHLRQGKRNVPAASQTFVDQNDAEDASARLSPVG
jgi:coproporphyrinogen III oxidase-like Fe-S oxidoreductase